MARTRAWAPWTATTTSQARRSSSRTPNEWRRIVRDAIIGICHEKNWDLLALHVRTNHVRVLVQADREPGRLMSDLKARASRELNRLEGPTHEPNQPTHEPKRAAQEVKRAAHEVSGHQTNPPAHEVSGLDVTTPPHTPTPVHRKRWTRHGSTLHLFTPDKVEEKIRYTIDEQGPKMEWYEKPRHTPPTNPNEPRTK